jgi:uncharacterized protein
MRCPKCGKSVPEKKFECACGYKVNFKRLPPPPHRVGMVNDYEGVLTGDYLSLLTRLTTEFERKTGIEIVIALLNNTLPLDPEKYAYFLYNSWKIGKKSKEGILILVSMKERRIETEIGFGLEKTISEEFTEKLLDSLVIPKFKDFNYGDGLVEGVKELIKEIETRSTASL